MIKQLFFIVSLCFKSSYVQKHNEISQIKNVVLLNNVLNKGNRLNYSSEQSRQSKGDEINSDLYFRYRSSPSRGLSLLLESISPTFSS